MNKQIITFDANEQSLIKTGGVDKYSSNKVSYIEAHFNLGENWSGYDSVRAVWFTWYECITTVLDPDGVCIVPHEVLARTDKVMVNLVGSISEDDVLTDRLTTYPVLALTVDANAKVCGSNTQPITPSEYEQFVEAVKADADRAEEAKDEARGFASSAETSAGNAHTSEVNASASEDNAKASELNAETHKNQAQTYAQNANNSAISAENAKDEAEDARDTILGMRAEATTLPEGSSATASYNDGAMSFGIPKGDTGARGATGETGATPQLSIGTVTTTTEPSVTITGTAENPVLNFGLVKGDKGDTGEVSQAEFDAAITDLKSAITQIIPTPTWTDGYISTTGAVATSSNYQYSSPIQIDYGRIVVTLTDDTIVSVVARYNESDGTYTSLLVGEGTNVHKQYVYDVTTPGKYVISYRKANGKSEIRIITSPQINSIPGLVEERTIYSASIPYESITGSYIRSDGKYANSTLYAHTKVMALAEGVYHIAAYGTTPVSILTSCDEAGNNRTSVIVADGSSAFDYTVSTEGYYIFSYRIEQGLTITRTSSVKEAIKYNEKEINAIKENVGNLEFKSTLLPVYTVGGYVNTYGQIASSSNYSYSSPILIKRGTLKVKCYADIVTAVISKTNAQGTAYTPVVLGDGILTLKTYSYEVTKEGYYCVSFRSASADAAVSIELNLYDELARIENESADSATSTVKVFKQDTITPNFTIKAFKTLNYSDGTTNKYSQVLWCDESTDTYYLSDNVYSEKHQIFTWDSVLAGNNDSSMYQAAILPNGDILFVFQTQFKNPTDDTAQGSYRRNPIICSASDGFELSEIDFGNSTKPTGWLQNVGAFYSYTYDRLFIAEYTRANEQYARIWAVDMPVTTVSNWTIILEKEIPTPYQTGFKHFHSCQQDPYTGILYFTSGDNDVSSAVWYSLDGGDTLVQLDDYNAGKYRMLNMAFTNDYVYWASDQWSPNHFLWRIARNQNTGVLDVSSLTKIVTFDDEAVEGISRIATYSTVFMPCFNCLVMLDRDDAGIHSSVPVRLYDITSGELYTIANMIPLSAGVNTGFRNVAVTCYVKSNEIVCSFDSKLLNYNKLLGNNSTSRINNLVIRIYKNGSSYAVDFDTVY